MPGLIVHEWIEKHGGAEKVVDAMTEAFPDAGIFTLWNDAAARYAMPVRESWLSRTPLRGRKAAALPLMSATWRRGLPTDERYDWMLVSSHLFAHHARLPRQPDVAKFVYVHTPARYLWTPEYDERGDRLVVRAAARYFRRLDHRRAQGEHRLAANSEFVRQRIQRFWDCDAEVIHPPVDVRRLCEADWEAEAEAEGSSPDRMPRGFIMGASRFIPYKRLETVIALGERLGVPVVIAGSGPLEASLRARAAAATVPVQVLVELSDAALFTLLGRAEMFVFPAIEDFGIMPVEAMALGTPVLVNRMGGAAESLALAGTGRSVAFDESLEEATAAGREILGAQTRGDPEAAMIFDTSRFVRSVRSWVGSAASHPTPEEPA